MGKYLFKSLYSMLFASVLGTVLLIVIDGFSSPIDILAILFYIILFALISWTALILPIHRLINKFFLKNKKRKIFLPFASAAYGFLAFIIIISALTREFQLLEFIKSPTTLSLIAAFIGYMWGRFYIYFYNKDIK